MDIEKHIYNNESEKALDILSTHKSELLNGDEAYFDLLFKISESDQDISYSEYLSFINTSIERNDVLKVEKFIEKNIELSISQSEYDEDLFEIDWNLLNQIREYGDIKKANDIYERLVFFSKNTKESATYEEFTRQKIRLQIHETVLLGIEKNVEQGLALCTQMLESATQIKDINLMIASYYFKSGFLVSTGNLEEYIADAEKCYELDEALANGSAFMPAIIQNMLDAYIYKGVNKSRVLELINDLESDPRTKDMILPISINSMSLFEEGSEERKEIFSKFNVDNVPDLASSGIGKELAREFAKDKIDVILTTRREDNLKELASELIADHEIQATVIALDLSKPAMADELYTKVKSLRKSVDFLVNNAGFGDNGDFLDCELSKQEEMVNLNIIALTKLCHLFGQDMKSNKNGTILNVAPTASFQPGPTMSVYFATKHYVLALSEAIAEELRPHNVFVSTLCPGPTQSEFGERAGFGKIIPGEGNPFPTSDIVARYGYKQMKNRKVVAIHGFWNAVQANLVRFVPRSIVRKMAHQKMKQ